MRGTKTAFLALEGMISIPFLFFIWDSNLIGDFLGHYKNVFSSFATAGQTGSQSQTSQNEATLGDWLDKWNKRQKKNESTESFGKSASQSTYTLPPGFPPLQELPPSLLPPPPGGYPGLPGVDWG